MSFFSGLFSGKSSINANNQAAEYNRNAINAGYSAANDAAKTGYDTATARYQPYAQQGQAANKLYGQSLGLEGAAGGQTALQAYQGAVNPFLEFEQQKAIKLQNNNANGMGRYYSGINALAGARASQELGKRSYDGWQGQLAGLGQQGYSTAGAQAALDGGYYGGQADRAIGQQNALAANYSQMTGANNAARTQGQTNLLSLVGGVAGGAIKGFAPGAGGVSAFGNMRNALYG